MTYRPAYAPLGKINYRGGKQAHERVRPPGLPYPDDQVYRYLVVNVDQFNTSFRTHGEVLKRRHQRRRFLESIIMDGDGCWIWVGPVNRTRSLPVFRGNWPDGTRNRPGHPFLWMIHEWFPDQVAHLDVRNRRSVAKCKKRMCVRPQCRKVGYNARNAARGLDRTWITRKIAPEAAVEIATQVRASRGYCPHRDCGATSTSRLHHADCQALVLALAERYGVSEQNVRDIRRGRTYRWAQRPAVALESLDAGPSTPSEPQGLSGAMRGVYDG